MSLPTRLLGGTGATVTALGFGSMELSGQPWSPQISDEEAGRVLEAALDCGITLVDTALDYGRSESLIGRYLAHRRDEFFLASKCACLLEEPVGMPPPFPHDYRPANVRAGVELSLKRLRTDHLDLVQVHLSPSRQVLEDHEVLATLEALRAEGKVRLVGMSGLLPNLVDQIAMGAFEVFQIPYSAVQREHETLISEAAAAGAGIIIRGGVARGAGSLDKGWNDPIGLDAGEAQRRWEAAALDDLVGAMGRAEFMLRFTISHPQVHSAIVGTSSFEHLAANVAAVERGPLAPDVYGEAKRRLSAAGSAPVAR